MTLDIKEVLEKVNSKYLAKQIHTVYKKWFMEMLGENLKFLDSKKGCGCGICRQIEAMNQIKQEMRDKLK